MKTVIKKIFIKVLVIFLLAAPTVFADYELTWSTIDGGGGTSSGGPYTLTGTIGQPDAGEMAGGDYMLAGGFWPGGPLLSCFVNFEHFAAFALYWLEPCGPGDNWCEGADFDWSTDVGISDVGELAYWWLAECPPDWPWE